MKRKNPKHWPKPPETLVDLVAIEAWYSVCEDLEALSTIDGTDRKLIEVYARDYAMKTRVQDELKGAPLLMTAENGRGFRHPLLDTYSKLSSKVQSVLNDLGLTPAARKAKPKPKDDENPYKNISYDGI